MGCTWPMLAMRCSPRRWRMPSLRGIGRAGRLPRRSNGGQRGPADFSDRLFGRVTGGLLAAEDADDQWAAIGHDEAGVVAHARKAARLGAPARPVGPRQIAGVA